MATDKIKNSLKFTIERAQNGFIITQVRFNDKTKQFEEVKEVVLDGSVNQRIGQLLQLEKLDMAVPLVYLIDVIMEKKYKEREDVETDEFMLLKMRFVKFKKHNPQNLAGLMIDDRIEDGADECKEDAAQYELKETSIHKTFAPVVIIFQKFHRALLMRRPAMQAISLSKNLRNNSQCPVQRTSDP